MADDLAEDWWAEDGIVTCEKDSTTKKKDSSQDEEEKPAAKSYFLKRKIVSEEEKKGQKKSRSGKKKDKKRLTRKRITTESDEVLTRPGSAEDVHTAITAVLKEKLGAQALEDILPDSDKDFYSHNVNLSSPSDYLKDILAPVWRSTLKKSLYLKVPGSPSVLLLCSSAIRAVELNRQIKEFCGGKCKVAKLFAKHMKVQEQQKYLRKTNCQLGIGTPARIALLIKSGALHLEHMICIVLDWNWRDAKLKRMVDVPEIRKELVSLLKDHLLEVVQGSPCKLALL